jgi:glycosyltransferase involved in cell wall biosynthesis
MRRLSGHVLYTPNVADTAHFAHALQPGPIDPQMAALPEPRFVFVGAISAAKVDFKLLRDVATQRPDWTLVLVGPVGLGDPSTDVSQLTSVPNINLLGPRGHDALPAVLRGAAAGLIPYVHSRLTDSIFPMKVYEYLAAGLPVIATALPALREAEDVMLADDAPATVAALERALAQDSPEQRHARSGAAAAHSWDARLAEIRDAIDRCPT